MLQVQKVRDLLVDRAADSAHPPFISAASGLIRVGDFLYVIADDELHLVRFSFRGSQAGKMYALFPGELPLDPKARKKIKPDIEALAFLSKSVSSLDGQLIAIPSGSKSHRIQGAAIELKSGGSIGAIISLDFGDLYEELGKHFSDLNIEGAVIAGGFLKLFQRGNSASAKNALIDLDLAVASEQIVEGALLANCLQGFTHYNLGHLNGVGLSFTDAATLQDGRLLFVAAAEDTRNTYDDGACGGSVVGILNAGGGIDLMKNFSAPVKVEGICVLKESEVIEFLFVTDADQPGIASELYRCQLSID